MSVFLFKNVKVFELLRYELSQFLIGQILFKRLLLFQGTKINLVFKKICLFFIEFPTANTYFFVIFKFKQAFEEPRTYIFIDKLCNIY